MKILYADKTVAVVEKPSNMPSQPDKTGDTDLLSQAAEQFGYAAIINRLDRGVGGIVLFALDKRAAASLSSQLHDNIRKDYLAVVCGAPLKQAELTDYLIKRQRTNTTIISNKNTKGAQQSKLVYKLAQQSKTEDYGLISMLYINLITGRHHQIRAQLNAAGLPIWGDVKYNVLFNKGGEMYKAALNLGHIITPALWAYKISFTHPQTQKPLTFESYPNAFPFTIFEMNLAHLF